MPPTLKTRKQNFQFYPELLAEGVTLEMMMLPAGDFLMGCPDGEDVADNEKPQHPVSLSQFFMAKTPITQAQWRAVTAMSKVERELTADPSTFKGSTRPVDSVTWYEAMEFCQRLSVYTRRTYTLPTESQWEYACRAGTETPFYFGKTLTPEVANYDGNYAYGPGIKGEYRQETTPVDFFALANPFGLYDMHGNVRDWCLDHWHRNYDGAPADGRAWVSDEKNSSRLLRGGSWSDNPWYCRSAYRSDRDPDFRSDRLGFRVVCLPQDSA